MAHLLEPFLRVQYLWLKHTVGVAVWRGLPVGQMEPRNLFNKNFVDSYPWNLSSMKLRCYMVRNDDVIWQQAYMDKDASSNFLLHILQVEPKPTYVCTYVDSYCKVTFYCALLLQEIYINNYCGHFPVFTYTEAFSSSPHHPPPSAMTFLESTMYHERVQY